MKNGNEAIRQKTQQKDPDVRKGTALGEQQSLKLARKERTDVRRPDKKQSSSEEKQRNIPATPTIPQKREERKEVVQVVRESIHEKEVSPKMKKENTGTLRNASNR
ncbi:unnamed protein product [Cylicostephanus goldi]|uniref:Uncharacterized protein n=1 Tax=Cylicostephanus goldi TaxID=71465 RepID=A0A3P7Q361_CYLGO|nr:unnamed protein product [Cylicostephanus goldi]